MFTLRASRLGPCSLGGMTPWRLVALQAFSFRGSEAWNMGVVARLAALEVVLESFVASETAQWLSNKRLEHAQMGFQKS